MENVAGGGEKSWVNMKLSETLTPALSPREAWFCTSARMSSAPCGDCGLKECCTGSCDWGVSPDNTRGSLVETLSVGPAALVVLSCHKNVVSKEEPDNALFQWVAPISKILLSPENNLYFCCLLAGVLRAVWIKACLCKHPQTRGVLF